MQRPDPIANRISKVPENFHEWNRNLATQFALDEDIRLTQEHWDVIYFLRRKCEAEGTSCNARKLLNNMVDEFALKGGKRYLYTLFPRGPVAQACKIAGIPLPANTLDPSFGSVH